MPRSLARSALALAGVIAIGTTGYSLIEGASWWDAFFMTIITLTTVGYQEVFPLSTAGEVFTVALLVVGFGLLLFTTVEVARRVVEGEVRSLLGQARRSRMLGKLSGHEIVCGWGRMGQAVAEELRRSRRRVVIVERSPEKIRTLERLGLTFVAGDATDEGVLREAGAERARGFVACLNDDAHNVYAVLTARSINPGLFIVARASEEGAEGRLLRAGANRVVNPYQIGGARLAHMLAKPGVVAFLDSSMTTQEGGQLVLEQVQVAADSPLAGRTLAETDLRRRHRVAVVSLLRGGQILPNPEADLRLAAGDVLVVLGARADLDVFENGVAAPAGEVE